MLIANGILRFFFEKNDHELIFFSKRTYTVEVAAELIF